MKEFYQDVKDRKAMATGARYKRNGSKTKFVSLPHDNMTPGAWKKMNGKVITYDLKSPLSWQQFKDLPNDLKIQYISNLQEMFNATSSGIARCFGIKPGYFYKYLRENQIHVSFPKGRGAKKADIQRLYDFFGIAENTEPQEPTLKNEPMIALEETQQPSIVANITKDHMKMPQFSLNFTGPFESEAIIQSLKFMLPEGTICSIRIVVEKED